MTEEYSYGWQDFKVRVLTESTLDESYNMQVWCEEVFGDRWAATPPGVNMQAWYFSTEADATLFRLRWT